MKKLVTLTEVLTEAAKNVMETILSTGMCKNVSGKVYEELCKNGYRNKYDLHFVEGTNTLYSEDFFRSDI